MIRSSEKNSMEIKSTIQVDLLRLLQSTHINQLSVPQFHSIHLLFSSFFPSLLALVLRVIKCMGFNTLFSFLISSPFEVLQNYRTKTLLTGSIG